MTGFALYCTVHNVLKKQRLTNLEFTSCVNLFSFVDCVAFELVLNKKSTADEEQKTHLLYYDTDMGPGSAYRVTPSSLNIQHFKNHTVITLKQIRNGT